MHQAQAINDLLHIYPTLEWIQLATPRLLRWTSQINENNPSLPAVVCVFSVYSPSVQKHDICGRIKAGRYDVTRPKAFDVSNGHFVLQYHLQFRVDLCEFRGKLTDSSVTRVFGFVYVAPHVCRVFIIRWLQCSNVKLLLFSAVYVCVVTSANFLSVKGES